jgi:hypothetical protein
MSIVLEDSNLNVAEQVNVLFKSSLGFPSTKESTPWFQETSVKYNNYVNGEEILLDEIPSNPSFSVTPNLVDVNVSSTQLATGGYIKEDSTRVIRQYHRLILTPVPNSSNNSYYALDSEGNNILTDGLQFNTKWSGSGNKIYPYTLYTQAFINADSNAPNELGQDSTGGNWLYDLKNGVIFFPDYSSSLCNGTTNKPVFSFYKYIGRKGVAKQIDFKNSLLDLALSKKYDKQIVVQTSDNTMHRYDSATTSWIPIGGSGGGGVWEESSSNSNIFYNSSGSVGIGTDNPQAKLHIAHAEGVSEDIISLRAEGTIRTYAPDADSHIRSEITSHHQGGKLLLYDGYQPTSTNNSNTNEIQVQLSAKINEYNYINNGGRVGIGITVPQAVLHVAQKNAVWDAISNPDPVTLRVEGGILVTDVDADIHHRIKIESDGQILIYGGYSPNETANVKISGNTHENNDGKTYFNAGNVGIGTTDPADKLHVYGGGATITGNLTVTGSYLGQNLVIDKNYNTSQHNAATISHKDHDDGSNAKEDNYNIYINSNGGLYLNSINNEDMLFRINRNTKMTLTNDGNLTLGGVFEGKYIRIDQHHYSNYNYSALMHKDLDYNVPGNYQLLMGSNGDTYLNAAEDKTLYFRIDNNTYMYINESGGIQTSALLHAKNTSTVTYSYDSYRIIDDNYNNVYTYNATDRSTSIVSDQSIWCKSYIFASSDRRIKKNIFEVDDDKALQKLRDISCCWYNYIDHLKRGKQRTIGFIAQQVKEQLPEAVHTLQDFIPNKMKFITDASWNSTTMLSNELLDVSGIKYKFYVSNDLSGNEKEIDLIGQNDNSFVFDQSYNYVFCYGKEVDDFHTLDKQKLFALNFSATQEIDRIQQHQLIDISQNKINIETLKIENDNLKLQNSTLTTKVNNLQSELTNLKSIVQDLIEAQMSS